MSNSNIPPVPSQTPHSMKCSSDSGRSSMREDRSPTVRRLPFRTFMHQKSSSIDESGLQSPREDIPLSAIRSKGLGPAHSNSFSAGIHRPDVSNVRATEGPPIRTSDALSCHSHSSAFIAEAPVGFRSTDSYRAVSPHSRTSDYESNTPTPEITSNSMIDYCTDLPMPFREHKPRLPMMCGRFAANQQRNNNNSNTSIHSHKVSFTGQQIYLHIKK